MIGLAAAGWVAQLLPDQGGAFAALHWQGREVLATLPQGGDPNACFAGAFVMAPWTNRLDAGRLGPWQLPVNRPDENTAIHGLSRALPWQVASAAADRAVLVQRVTQPPFDYAARLEVTLAAQGCALTLTLEQRSAAAVPMGLGWHPWFRRVPGTALHFAARQAFGTDARNLPVAMRPSPGVDAVAETIDGMDRHFSGWDGALLLRRPDLLLRLEASGAWAGNLQVFVPRGGAVLCAEPVSHVPDVANQPRFAAQGAMAMLRPGETLRGSLLLSCTN